MARASTNAASYAVSKTLCLLGSFHWHVHSYRRLPQRSSGPGYPKLSLQVLECSSLSKRIR